jgi:hypothetical protein
MAKVLIVEFCASKREVDCRFWLLALCSSSPFFFKKIKTGKKWAHQHSQHTVHDGVSGVTEEGCHPSVPMCLVSGTGSAVREV